MGRVLLWASLAVVLAAAAREGAVALDLIGVGRLPGEEAPGEPLRGTALLVILMGGLVVAGLGLGGWVRRTPALGLVPLAGFSLLLSHYYSYDPYYAPSLRRFSDGAFLPLSAVVPAGVLAAAVAALLSFATTVRGGAIAAGVLLPGVCILTLFSGIGH